MQAGSGEIYDKFKKETVSKIAVVLRVTLKGVSRVNVGDGSDFLQAFSIAIRRCGESFGIGRYLYAVPERVMVLWSKDISYQKPLTMEMVKQLQESKIEIDGKMTSQAFIKKNVLSGLPQNGGGNGKGNSEGKKKGNPKSVFMKAMEKAKQNIFDLTGDQDHKEYYLILDGYGYEKSNEVETKQEFRKVYDAMESVVNRLAV